MFKLDEFVDVVGYEGLYAINKKGEVYSYRRKTIMMMSLVYSGYYSIHLRKNNKFKSCYVHRLVAETFIKNNENKPYVNHKDGNKTNNDINNLEWCTKSENNSHACRTGLNPISEKLKQVTANRKRIITFSQAQEIREKYKSKNFSQYKLAEMYGITRSSIQQIVENKSYLKENFI